jgi:chromosomal replication initiation ATPase DnaA
MIDRTHVPVQAPPQKVVDLKQPEQCPIERIAKVISKATGVSIEQLKDKTRKREIVIARQVAMYFVNNTTGYSLKSIGFWFGGRDHSTVIHAVQTVEDLLSTNKSFRENLAKLTDMIIPKVNWDTGETYAVEVSEKIILNKAAR